VIATPPTWTPSSVPAVRQRVPWAANFRRYRAAFAVSARPHDPDGAHAAGFRTFVTWEPEADTPYLQARIVGAGLQFFRIPVPDEDAPTDADMATFLGIVGNPNYSPVLACCHGGEHRSNTGACCVRIAFDGWTLKDALHEAERFDVAHGPVPPWLTRLWEGGPLSRKQNAWLPEWCKRNGLGGLGA
jgi:protein tyrosine phosphatase (PTP) superfamily phosphohydrolase (DUF442 family)